MIKALIFDLGGVVITDGWVAVKEVGKRYGIPTVKLKRLWKQSFNAFFKGNISEDEFWQRLLRTSDKKLINKVKREFRCLFEANREILPLLKQLKKSYFIAALTNNSKEWLRFQSKKFKLSKYFNQIVSSHKFGAIKTEKSLFDKAIHTTGVRASNILYVDDKREYLEFAKRHFPGIKTVLFNYQKHSINMLKKHLPTLSRKS